MSAGGADISGRAAALANRLRLIQADFADDSAEVRRAQLEEEVGRAVESLGEQERMALLKELEERFPSWDSNVSAKSAPTTAAPVRSAMDDKELADPSFLVRRLVSLAAGLSPEQRLGVASTLKQAGYEMESAGGLPEAAAQLVCVELGLSKEKLDAGRTLELLAIVLVVVKSLDQLSWNTWKTVAPRSAVRRTGDLVRQMGRYAVGDNEVSKTQVRQEVERLRQLVAALISSVGRAGGQFAQKHVSRFSPMEIETAVRAGGGGGFLSNTKVKCWEAYVEMARTMDAASIEAELRESIASFAESLMKGLGR